MSGQSEFDLLGRTINSLAESLGRTLVELQESVQRLSEGEERYRQIADQRLQLERIINASPTLALQSRIENGYPIEFASASLEQFGYPLADLSQQPLTLLQLVAPKDRERVETVIDQQLAERNTREFFLEFAVRSAGGELRTVDCRLLVERDEQGRATHLQGVFLDISEKLRLREQAAQASRLAALGELAAGVAHEINNPNGMILFNATVLKDLGARMLQQLDELWRERGELDLGRIPYAQLRVEIPRLQTEVLDAAGRIRRIVEDLKAFARSDTPECRQEVDLNVVAQTAVRLTGNALKQATDRFAADYAEGIPRVSGHAQRLEQVVVNLLLNACQALPDRNCRITLRTFVLPDCSAVCLSVEDEGVGIPPEHLSHVTDPFFTTRREQGGTGIGLSVSARIVKEHEGRLEISSIPGKGTMVQVILPLPAKESNG
jgi:PAS domain S-box-containing protein